MAEAGRRVVLVGAGHAHLAVADKAGEFARRGVELLLIDPGEFWYSGSATGMLAGLYDDAFDRIDPARLIRSRGGVFRRDRMAGLSLDPPAVRLASGEEVAFDLLSLNLGSEVAVEKVEGAGEHAWPVKPIANLWRLRRRLEERFRDEPKRRPRVTVIGAGPTGCEVAACLRGLGRRHRAEVGVTLIASRDRLIPSENERAARRLRRDLEKRGVALRFESRAGCVEPGCVRLEDGTSLDTDETVIATGLRAPKLVGDLPLAADATGGVHIGPTLQAEGDPRVFAAGDCARFLSRDLPKLGVFGVRQAQVLMPNLLARLDGKPLGEYEPQSRYLAILNYGDGSALAIRGRWHYAGRAAMVVKHYIDARFLAQYRRSPLPW